MKEDYLHQIWNKKRLPFHRMKLTDGKSIIVKSTGSYNLDSGPDFFNGEVLIDEISWVGNIEIHVKSSDWYLHKHQFDAAYENVILHVVYEYDKDVFINGRIVPTLELKNFIQDEHYQYHLINTTATSEFVCSKSILNLDPIYLELMKEKAIFQRLDRKIEPFITNLNSEINYSQILYEMLGQSFGMKLNALPFQELTKRIPLRILKRESIEYTNSLIFGVSGFINNLEFDDLSGWKFLKEKHLLNSMPSFEWKRKGVRPVGFPLQRLTQFVEVVKRFDFNLIFLNLEVSKMISFFYDILDISDISDISVINEHAKNSKLKMSNSIKDLIIINCFVPFLWWFGKIKSEELFFEKALDVLSLISPEKNRITKKWNQLGVETKKAYDSQALLEIYNEFCFKKKCLSCTIGNKILKG